MGKTARNDRVRWLNPKIFLKFPMILVVQLKI